jgi:hypothetical protein
MIVDAARKTLEPLYPSIAPLLVRSALPENSSSVDPFPAYLVDRRQDSRHKEALQACMIRPACLLLQLATLTTWECPVMPSCVFL